MPRISKLTSKEPKPFKVEFQGEHIEGTYRSDIYTAKLERELFEMSASPLQQGQSLCKLASKLIVSWDVMNDDGSVFEPTEENLSTLPVTFVSEVVKTIGDDIRGNPTGKESGSFAEPS